jgi:RNA polymerase sigma-B factor
MQLVYHIARKNIKPPQDEFEDYVQEGMIGLIKSAIRFDESRGYSFSTYAFPVIIGAMKRYRRDNTMVSMPRNHYSDYIRIVTYKNSHKDAQKDEIIKELGLTTYKFKAAMQYFDCDSLDRNVSDDLNSPVSIVDTISGEDAYEALHGMLVEESIIEILEKTLKFASKQHRAVYEEFFYPLLFGEKVSQMDIGAKYGISQVQVSRIINKYNELLKQHLVFNEIL